MIMRTVPLFAGIALVASAAATGQTPIGVLDTDRDGSISRTEAEANLALSAQFTALDKNGNGALEPAEFARFETLGAESTSGNTTRNPEITPPPPMGSTPPPMSSTPPPMTSTPPPMSSTPPPNPSTPPPQGGMPPPSP